MNLDIARDLLSAQNPDNFDGFAFLKSCAALINSDPELARELLIRALERKILFKKEMVFFDSLLRQAGLFPYITTPTQLSVKDSFAYELHKPFNQSNDELVLHRAQAKIYWELLDGKNVVLSAPTSFGKSLLVDMVVGSHLYSVIVLVVPTLALIDETRKRLKAKFADYQIITHASQLRKNINAIYILTQERVLERNDLEDVEFFVIDEFYKLDSLMGDRAFQLNHALYKLLRICNQFYMLGPNIDSIPFDFEDQFNTQLSISRFTTVAADIIEMDVSAYQNDAAALLELCATIEGPTLIFCSSPANAFKVARLLIDEHEDIPGSNDLTAWLSDNYHSEWVLTKSLKKGIGIHHGRLPRSLTQLQVKLFNEERLKFLICTSTLIEGVNTAAQNIIVYDNTINRKPLDYFTYKNIIGRAGRMWKHYVGKVYLFHKPPDPSKVDVAFPFIDQETANDGLLIQMEGDDLQPSSKERLNQYFSDPLLDFETLKLNSHIDPELQLALAHYIKNNAKNLYKGLNWEGMPKKPQLYETCELLTAYILPLGKSSAVRTSRELAFLLGKLRACGSVSNFIRDTVQNSDTNIDDDIDGALDFVRNWATYKFPRALTALHNIQNSVFGKMGWKPGNYLAFATLLENDMLPSPLGALDEFGIPSQITEKISNLLTKTPDLDKIIAQIKNLNFTKSSLTPFELDWLDLLRKTL